MYLHKHIIDPTKKIFFQQNYKKIDKIFNKLLSNQELILWASKQNLAKTMSGI